MKKQLEPLFEQFIEECSYSLGLSPETIRGYQNTFRLFRQEMPTVTLDTINESTVIAFFNALRNRKRVVGRGDKIKQGVKNSTIATHRSKLNKFFKWLKRKNYLAKNPFDEMEYPNIRYEDRKFLFSHQVERIFIALSHNIDWQNNFVKKRNVAIFTALFAVGLRKGELLGLKLLDLDFDRNLLRVDGQTSKSKRERRIPINRDLLLALKDYLEERKKLQYETPYLFVSHTRDDKLTAAGLKHLLAKVENEVGFHFHAHQFRHTFAINLLNKGTDIAKLQQLMGHRDIRMTASYLRCLPPNAMRGDVELLTLDQLL